MFTSMVVFIKIKLNEIFVYLHEISFFTIYFATKAKIQHEKLPFAFTLDRVSGQLE